ncbi:translation initiation factor IF-2 [Pacificimonas flava]|uniref:Translation initiation factor IF-2 n=2 Tax=Pacificimonas TaxID=1960290 RepID=A0A219B1Z2_9SPHN|nr:MULTISPECIES: translation initiation factor IF-2 [Pacificimonas]MBZ6378231.1 translation initiation factor IF-2 [Pacificimonas aurantium]OWV32143.1 translation initiation factor IF-2 [Pacificimonas flava]
MSDEKKTLGTRKPLGVKKTVDVGKVQQQFSHGRKKSVVVERKRRFVKKPGEQEQAKEEPAQDAAPEAAPERPKMPEAPKPPFTPNPSAPPAPPKPAPKAKESEEAPAAKPETAPEPSPQPSEDAKPAAETAATEAPEKKAEAAPGKKAEAAPAPASRQRRPAPTPPQTQLSRRELQDKLLREAEEERLRFAEEARRREDERRQNQQEEEARRAEENRRREEEEARLAAEREKAEREAAERAAAQPEPAAEPEPDRKKESRKKDDRKPAPSRGGRGERKSGKLTISSATRGEDSRVPSMARLRRMREKEKREGQFNPAEAKKQVREIVVPEAITIQELANRMAERGADLVKKLFEQGEMVTVNQTIDQDTAELLVEDFGHKVKRVSDADVELGLSRSEDDEASLQPRPPVVTIMGHVDHGKTSLLDALRGTDVTRGEAGGITQHIGAYQVTPKNSGPITFLDTPGHQAFSEMRARGANVTDIVVLVVAADDGLMPQTIEAINHTKAAGVPMIVAINKMDKEGADPTQVRTRLLEHEVIVEEMSGDVQDVEVSALKKQNLDKLIEAINLQAELLELKANPDRDAEATVVEAKLDKGRGPVATVLVNKGTLRRGDIFVVGAQQGKVRALVDEHGKQVKEAGPAKPVEVLGLSGVPMAGDTLTVVENERRAAEVAEYRAEQLKKKRLATAPTSVDAMFGALADKTEEYPVVVKGDVQGSVEAIVSALHEISTDDIKVRVLHSGVGAITESDVTLAAASGAPIYGFNVRPNANARQAAEKQGSELRYYDVIYDLIDETKAAMAGQLGPERIENVVGRAEIKEVFPAGKTGKAAGMLVTEGVLKQGIRSRITRDDVIIYNGKIDSLRRFKDDVDEVRAGLECGAVFENFKDIKAGDFLETFEIEERERVL